MTAGRYFHDRIRKRYLLARTKTARERFGREPGAGDRLLPPRPRHSGGFAKSVQTDTHVDGE
jgi:hypothetical protein